MTRIAAYTATLAPGLAWRTWCPTRSSCTGAALGCLSTTIIKRMISYIPAYIYTYVQLFLRPSLRMREFPYGPSADWEHTHLTINGNRKISLLTDVRPQVHHPSWEKRRWRILYLFSIFNHKRTQGVVAYAITNFPIYSYKLESL